MPLVFVTPSRTLPSRVAIGLGLVGRICFVWRGSPFEKRSRMEGRWHVYMPLTYNNAIAVYISIESI